MLEISNRANLPIGTNFQMDKIVPQPRLLLILRILILPASLALQ